DLSTSSLEIKQHGGIKSFAVLKEEIVGDVAEVSVQITRGNDNVIAVRYKLIKEQGSWKIDGVNTPDANAVDPAHPESAVQDVVNWAHQANVINIQSWLKTQPPPAICTANSIGRNDLPDVVKYHDVDEPQIRERLIKALLPVLNFVGCSSTTGVILYKGPNIYAGTLAGGSVAITPGDAYFIGTPPDEN